MTNHPIPPLSAEFIASEAYVYFTSCNTASYCFLEEKIEAYAAEQTAPLTATIATITKLCKSEKRLGPGGCDMASMERRQGRSQLAKQILDLLTNLPAAAQAHLDEVAGLKSQVERLTDQLGAFAAGEMQAENERLKAQVESLQIQFEKAEIERDALQAGVNW